MPGFLYYLPRSGSVNALKISEAGLGYVFGDGNYTQVPVTHGPDEAGSGVVIATCDTEQPGYYPDRQDWTPYGAYWIGWARGAKPGPEDLQRKNIRDSYRFSISDGNEWLCPVARALPSYWGFDEDSNRVRMIRPEFLALSKRADEAWQQWNEEDGHFDQEWIMGVEAADICIDALALNYRIGPYEAAALCIPTAEDSVVILAALLDIPNGAQKPKDEAKKND